MNSWLRTLRIGDRCRIGSTEYVTSAQLSCRRADGETWTEWLLRPQPYVENGDRWLAWEEGNGLILWRHAELPPGSLPGEVSQLTTMTFEGKRYRRAERDHFTVAHIGGDVHGDCRTGDRIHYADFVAGDRRLSVEWDDSGLDVHSGQVVTPIAVLEWYEAAGVNLKRRASMRVQRVLAGPAEQPQASAVDEVWNNRHAGEGLAGVVMAIPIVLFMLLADGCSDDCTARNSAQTGRTEYVCPDGSVRHSKGWFGK